MLRKLSIDNHRGKMMPSDRSEIKDTYRIIVLFWLMFVSVLIPYPSFAQDRIIATYTLPDTAIKGFQNAVLPGSVANDRKVLLGSVGSDLWHGPKDPRDEFWMITDRGPNGQIAVDGKNRRTFWVPEFNPTILRVKTEGKAIKILDAIPIVGQSGKPVTGLPNLKDVDEAPYNYSAQELLPLNPNGLDTEGLVRSTAGDFWISEEYSPSIVRVDRTGKVISPLLNPDRKTGEVSRNTRVLVFDIPSEKVTAEYVYRFDVSKEFDPNPKNTPDEMKLSGVISINPTTLLILERTDLVAKLYSVDLSQATNVLGSKWNDAKTAPALEALANPATAEVRVLPKSLVLDLSSLAGMPEKIEGIALIDQSTIAVSNDNDFDSEESKYDANGNNVGKGKMSQILSISLAKPLPLPQSTVVKLSESR
jgi:hypothetical protein